MKIKYYTQDGKLYNDPGCEIVPDDEGVIKIMFCGEEKRFVRDLFVTYINNNPHIQQIKPVRKTARRWGIRKKPNVPVGTLPHASVAKRLPVKVLDATGKELGPFESISVCARELKMSKSQISKYIRGEMKNSKGFRFERIERKTA